MVKPLGELSDIKYGYTASASTEPIGPRFLRITDIQDGVVNWAQVPFCDLSEKDHARHKVQDGDIVFARTGATTGKSFYIREAPDAVCASYLIKVRPNAREANSGFLNLYFQTAEYWETIALGTEGAAQGGFNASKLAALRIPLPPLDEQQRIVAILDEAFEGLDRARANAEANLASARELIENFLALTFEFAQWPTKTLTDIAENLDRKRVPITKSKRKAGNVPYYGASGVVDYVADYLFDEDLLLVSEDGANLLARTYPIAFSISGRSWVNNHAHILRFEDLATQEFVRLYLNSISLVPYVSGMAQPKLNQAKLNQIPIPYPDATARSDFVSKAEELSTRVEELRGRYEADLQNLVGLRQSLLHRAFAGELT